MHISFIAGDSLFFSSIAESSSQTRKEKKVSAFPMTALCAK